MRLDLITQMGQPSPGANEPGGSPNGAPQVNLAAGEEVLRLKKSSAVRIGAWDYISVRMGGYLRWVAASVGGVGADGATTYVDGDARGTEKLGSQACRLLVKALIAIETKEGASANLVIEKKDTMVQQKHKTIQCFVAVGIRTHSKLNLLRSISPMPATVSDMLTVCSAGMQEIVFPAPALLIDESLIELGKLSESHQQLCIPNLEARTSEKLARAKDSAL
ncbi:hypothetical protein B0H17DRAFT_1126344 [Mycena rosella]|uniref:Uncharacterized protein n=1 Tax=Mycena rosella TaxID=1033263 RepID=A0AAD7GUD8_MYCRO|nr:hypothetical protein B0H17DRAFT_1126344 [Mycena rosella]